MKIKGIKTDFVEVEIAEKELFDSFLRLIYSKIPINHSQYKIWMDENGKIWLTEEILGHNRDFEDHKLSDIYPKLKLTTDQLKLIRLIRDLNIIHNYLLFNK